MKLKTIVIALSLLTVLSTAVGLLFFYRSLREAAFAEDRLVSVWHTHDVENAFSLLIDQYQRTARLLSRQSPLAAALAAPTPGRIGEANRVLDRFQADMETSVCYLMDRHGMTLGSSNRNTAESFVGKSYAFRPYFRTAVGGAAGIYAALGVTSGKRGLYFSHPVIAPNGNEILGVAVVKQVVAELENRFLGFHYTGQKGFRHITTVTDPDGIIFASDSKSLLYESLWPMPDEKKALLDASKQYGREPGRWSGFRRMDDGRAVDAEGREYQVQENIIDRMPGWRVTHLSDRAAITAKARKSFFQAAGYVMVVIFVLIGFGALLLTRLAAREISRRRETEERFRQIFNHMGTGVAVYEAVGDAEDFRFRDINPAGAQIGQMDREAHRGRSVLEVYPGVRDLGLFDVLQRVWRTGRAEHFPLNAYRDGRIAIWVENYVCKLPSGEIIAIYDDVTETKQAEEEKRQLTEQLRQLQKIEAIGALAGGIAHDFNNILFPITGLTELLIEDTPSESPIQESLREILAGATRARDLVRQILTFSRQAEQEIKPIRIQDVLNEVLRLVRPTLPSTIEIHSRIDAACGLVMADSTQIHQVVMNLITNAYHAMMETGGVLDIVLEPVSLSLEELVDPTMTPGEHLCLSVSDTGHGMAPDVVEKIFNPYFSTKAKDKGTGLGLSVVHGIIKSHGGGIGVESEPGRGSVFRIYLPVRATTHHGTQQAVAGEAPEGNERILLVDDEPAIVNMMKNMLERLGYRVTPRTSSLEALEAFGANPERFDLILTDMTMPQMTGMELARRARQLAPNVRIVLCTGFSEHVNEETAAAAGIEGFVMKPVVKSDLAHAIRNALDGGAPPAL